VEKEGRFGSPIAASLARSLGGSLAHDRQPSGAAWELRLPLGELVRDRTGPMAA
jgi:two-component sensor histidine kinase